MAATTGAEGEKAIKDLTLVFCRRRSPNDAARQGKAGLVFFYVRFSRIDADLSGA